jgi:uncharacterized membrane-anchored protein
MKRIFSAILILFCISFFRAQAQQDSLSVDADSLLANTIRGKNIDSLLSTFKYLSGHLFLNTVATVDVPQGFKFLAPKDAQTVLTDFWNNPPDETILGMLVQDSIDYLDDSSWVITFSYDEDGYVKDDDAEKINYDELLQQMQEDTRNANEERVRKGYNKLTLVGWAQTPYYDKSSHKLHWAKELIVDDDSSYRNLNYNIRMLGRKGVLIMNVIAGVESLDDVKSHMNEILASTNFNMGSRYEDFDDKTDKIAEYGIGALVAGAVLAKTGLLTKLGLLLAAGWKFIAAGVIAFFGFFRRKFLSKKNQNNF